MNLKNNVHVTNAQTIAKYAAIPLAFIGVAVLGALVNDPDLTAPTEPAPVEPAQVVEAPKPVTNAWDDTETFSYCYRQARVRLGKVKWGFAGIPSYTIHPTFKTVILEGQFQNSFGVMTPFAIECRETNNGPQVVEIN